MGQSRGGCAPSATIFRRAMEHNAAGIVLVHNHPSGDAEPSADDIEVTDMLRALGRPHDVTPLDHIIVTEQGWRSVPDKGGRGDKHSANITAGTAAMSSRRRHCPHPKTTTRKLNNYPSGG